MERVGKALTRDWTKKFLTEREYRKNAQEDESVMRYGVKLREVPRRVGRLRSTAILDEHQLDKNMVMCLGRIKRSKRRTKRT